MRSGSANAARTWACSLHKLSAVGGRIFRTVQHELTLTSKDENGGAEHAYVRSGFANAVRTWACSLHKLSAVGTSYGRSRSAVVFSKQIKRITS